MEATRKFLAELGFPSRDLYALPSSPKRFPDEAQYRFEIPSVEGPRCLRAVIEEAQRYRLTIHRVSQGSGIMLLTDEEIKDMLRMAKDQQLPVNPLRIVSKLSKRTRCGTSSCRRLRSRGGRPRRSSCG